MGDIWGLGGSSLISRLLGEKKDDEAAGVSALCDYLALLTGLLFMTIMLLFKGRILHLLGANEGSMAHAGAYFRWIALGTPFIIFSMIPNNQLRTEGLANLGMWGAIAGTVANVILDPILIFGLKMGAAGAALATSLSNLLSCVIYLFIIIKKCHVLTVSPRAALDSVKRTKEVLRIGVPASVTNIMNSLSMMITNRFLSLYGNDSIAAMGIAMKINMISMMTIIGFAFGGQPLFGYTYGSKNKPRFRKTLRFAYLLELGLGIVFAVILYIAAPFLLSVFMKEAAVAAAGARMLRFMQLSSLLVGVSLVTTCVCQAVGNAGGALILSAARQGVIFVLSIYLLHSLMGLTGIMLAQPAADLLTGIAAIVIISGVLKEM